jgi:type IV pilus assembly protein PilX
MLLRNPQRHASRLATGQRGTALVAGLVFLVILVLLGLSASSAAIQQEIVVRNIRDENLAFRAAETALRTAETWIQNNKGPTPPDMAGLLLGTDPTIHNSVTTDLCGKLCKSGDASWWGDEKNLFVVEYGENPLNPATPIPDVAEQPSYVIELAGMHKSLAPNDPTPPTRSYRITARGVGINDKTVRVVQTVYRY